MKLHLPIALLAAVVGAMSMTQAADEATFEYSVTGNPGLFTQDTSIEFTGDWTNVNFENKAGMGSGDFGYEGNGDVGGLKPSGDTITANNVEVKVGAADKTTNISTVIGVGSAGYAATGNKTITITGDNTYVGAIIGGNNISAASAAGYATGTYEVTGVSDSQIKFAKKSDTDKSITINVEAGSVGQIRGGSSGHSGKVDAAINKAWQHYTAAHNAKEYASDAERQAAIRKDVEAYVAEAPWIRNEEINITVSGDSKVGYKEDGVTPYETNGEASIYGAGGTAHSVNNDINILITDNAEIKGNILGGAVANTYSKISGTNTTFSATAVNSSVKNTHITIAGESKVDGNVYGGGWSKKADSTATVKGNTTVVLEGGSVTGYVYGAGHDDLVEGNTKVVIKGEGADVTGTIYGGGEGRATVNGDRILAFEAYEGEMQWDKYENFNALEFTDMTTSTDLSSVSNEFTESVKIDNSTVTDGNADRQMGKLTLVDSGKYENSGKATIDKVVAGNTATPVGEPDANGVYHGVEVSNSKAELVNNGGEMTVGDIWNTAVRDAKNTTGTSELALVNKGDNAKLTITGEVRNANYVGEYAKTTLHQEGGTVEFAGAEGKDAQLYLAGEGNSGTLVHSGDGNVQITGANAGLGASYSIEQSGNGSLVLNGTYGDTTQKTSVAISQTGKGNIALDATFYAATGSAFTVMQNGGGTVTVTQDGMFSAIDVSNGSTFENQASVTVADVAVSNATLSTTGELGMQVFSSLALENATLAINADSFTSDSGAIMMHPGSELTSLDCDAYTIVFGQGTEGLDSVLSGATLGQEFSVSLLAGFNEDNGDFAKAEALCDAFNADMLTLQAVDAKGNVIDLLVNDATLSFNGGAIVLSGTASIPEPTTATLSLLALAALAARRRRRK